MSKSNEVTITALMEGAKGKITRVSPKGIAVYPHLLVPDEYQIKKNNKHECNTSLRLDPSNKGVQPLLDELDTMCEEAFETGLAQLKSTMSELKGKKLAARKKHIKDLEVHKPYEMEVDDEGEETGLVLLKAKTTVSGIDKKTEERWHREVPIFDSKGQKIQGKARASMKLWGGSEIVISFLVNPFCAEGLDIAGCSLRLGAVQVFSLSGSDADAEDYGFGVEGGGYEADTFDNAVDSDDEVEESDEDEDEEEF